VDQTNYLAAGMITSPEVAGGGQLTEVEEVEEARVPGTAQGLDCT